MQVNYHDGHKELLDALEVEPYSTLEEKLKQALNNPKVQSVELHKPGSVITHSDGRKYIVNANGQWERIDDE